MERATQPVYVDDIPFDAMIDNEEDYTASVPSYTTENGYNVSDTIILEQFALGMTLYVSEAPLTWEENGHGKEHVMDIINRLRELYEQRTLVTVTTPDDVFENMAIESLTISRDVDIGYSREVPISFKQIRVTEAKTADIPSSYYYSGKTSTSTGNTGTETSDDAVGSSLLYSITSSAGIKIGG